MSESRRCSISWIGAVVSMATSQMGGGFQQMQSDNRGGGEWAGRAEAHRRREEVKNERLGASTAEVDGNDVGSRNNRAGLVCKDGNACVAWLQRRLHHPDGKARAGSVKSHLSLHSHHAIACVAFAFALPSACHCDLDLMRNYIYADTENVQISTFPQAMALVRTQTSQEICMAALPFSFDFLDSAR